MDNFFEQAFQEENPVIDETPVETDEQHAPISDDSASEPTTDVATEQSTEETAEQPEVVVPQTFEIDGQQVTLEELQKGYMRQSDYTKKTQELARMRGEGQQEQAPQTQQQYSNPFEQRVVELEQRLADKELDDTLTRLKSQYPDFDEIKVLNTAYEKGLTDLEFVYKSTREITMPDMDSIKSQLRAEIMQELTQSKAETGTIISHGSAPLQASTPKLSEQERLMAEEFGLTEEEYINYR